MRVHVKKCKIPEYILCENYYLIYIIMGKFRSAVNLLIRYREIVTVSLLQLSLALHVLRSSSDILFSETFSIHEKHKIHIESSEIIMNIKTKHQKIYQNVISTSVHIDPERTTELTKFILESIFTRDFISFIPHCTILASSHQ